MTFSFVLSDSLYGQFHKFKHGQACDTAIVENLLNLYRAPHLTNVEQLKRLNISDSALVSQLAQAGFNDQNLKNISKQTVFKIVLDETEKKDHYVNILVDELRSDYTITCLPGSNRSKATEFLKAQLENAQDVFLYDCFFAKNWNLAKRFFADLLPNKKLTIYFSESHLSGKEPQIKGFFSKWTIKQDKAKLQYRKLHDRYLLIDKKMEIIISSGFDNLFDTQKECTLVIRDLRQNQAGGGQK